MAQRSTETVFMTGEPELVAEYGLLFAEAAYRVVTLPQLSTARSALPPVIKKSASIPKATIIGVELTNTDRSRKKTHLRFLDGKLPKGALLLSSSVTVAGHEQASWIKHPERLLGIAALPTFAQRKLIELAPCVETNKASLECAAGLFARLGREIAVIQDRVGMVAPRVVCAIINEACFAVGEGIASPADIDTAMKLGTNYPRGPIEWGNAIGFDQVTAVLEALHHDLGDDRYRISPVLRHLSSLRR